MASFYSFGSCTILENSIYYAGFLVHLGRFHRCNCGWVGLADTGSNRKPRILSSIFSREVFQISAWKYLCCVQQKAFGVFIFPYFVFSWYILVQSFVKTFSKRIHFFIFLFSSGILFFKLIETTSYFSKTNILTNKAPLVLIFFWIGIHTMQGWTATARLNSHCKTEQPLQGMELHITRKIIITCQSKEQATK